MLALLVLLSLLFAAAPAPLWAKPLPPRAGTPQAHPDGVLADLLSLLCEIKPLNKIFCQQKGSLAISTPLGTATGVADSSTVGRFAVRFASANRWQPAVMATSWQFPNNSTDPSALPLACPQPPNAVNSQDTSEDCLSMLIYVPSTAAQGKIPALMWIHGGSFVIGSATAPGLDGAKLAQATNSIVAVVQYRLGAFGFMSPSGQGNLAVKDMIAALQFLQKILPSFNGDTSKVTIAGQSSGATMVRALLATPSASNLFKSAMLHSDPMDYGFLTTGAFQSINNFFISQLSCNKSDTSCLNAMSTDAVLDVSNTVFSGAVTIDASAGQFEPLRPVKDGSLITSAMDLTETFPSVSKNIIITTVQNEAGPAIFNSVTSFLPEAYLSQAVNQSLGEPRTSNLLNSSFYTVPPSLADSSAYDARLQLVSMGTDQIWRCPSWSFARLWAAAGGKAFVGEHVVGSTYVDNTGVSFCTEGGTVCHEDDIEILFGTASKPTSAQTKAISEIQARVKSFLNTGAPSASGFQTWSSVSGSTVNSINIGGTGLTAIAACTPSFWGQMVPYDYQIFGA